MQTYGHHKFMNEIYSYQERVERAEAGLCKSVKAINCPVCGRLELCGVENELIACWHCTQLLCFGALRRDKNGKIKRNPKYRPEPEPVEEMPELLVKRKRRKRITANDVRKMVAKAKREVAV